MGEIKFVREKKTGHLYEVRSTSYGFYLKCLSNMSFTFYKGRNYLKDRALITNIDADMLWMKDNFI
jgi:hypothetical protein